MAELLEGGFWAFFQRKNVTATGRRAARMFHLANRQQKTNRVDTDTLHCAIERGKKVKTELTSPNINSGTINSNSNPIKNSIGSQKKNAQACGSNIHRKPRPHHTCLIHLFLTHYPPSPDSAREPKRVGNPVWSGRSWDAAGFPRQTLTTSVVFGIDDTHATREAIITDLKHQAIVRGYTHCEVRDFSTAQSGHYTPLYGGPLND